MPASAPPAPACVSSANREAHLLLGMLMERTGIRRAELLALLAELGYEVSDDTFTNWGRRGRSFPRDWRLLRAIVGILSQPRLARRCTAAEALRFFALTGLPFCELATVAALFPPEEFAQAMLEYLPEALVEQLRAQGQLATLERAVSQHRGSAEASATEAPQPASSRAFDALIVNS